MTKNLLNNLLKTIREDKEKVLRGLRDQDQERLFSTPEVIAMLDLSFTLVEASVMTEMDEEVNNQKPSISPRAIKQ